MSIDWQAFRLTIELAVVVSVILTMVGVPLASWIAYSRWRWKFLVEALVALPIVLPPTVLGFYVLVALGSRSPLGRWWQSLTGHTLAFTFTGLVIGSILYSLPFAVQPFAASFSAVDQKAAGGVGHAGSFAVTYFLPCGGSVVCAGAGHGRRLGICSHHGRVRSGADDRRQHSRSDAHSLDRYLRSGAGLQLRRRKCHRVAFADFLLRSADAGLWAEPENASC